MKKEFLIAASIAIFVLVLSNLSFFIPFFSPKSGLVFLGRRFLNSQDTYTYVSFIEQSKQGRWLFENLYTSEPQKAQISRPSYFVIGKLAKIFNLSSILAYHLSRILFAIAFLIVLYRFIYLFFNQSSQRLLAFLLTTTSSGFGSFLGKWIPNSVDIWIPEGITFLTLAESPHFILSQLFMVLGFSFFLKATNSSFSKYFLFSAISFLILSLEHPFNMGVVFLTLVLLTFWLKKFWLSTFLVIAISSLGIVYQLYQLYLNPVMRSWAFQNNLAAPDPLSVVSGYGLILILAIIGTEKLMSKLTGKEVLLLFWIASTFVLLYTPVNFQRRLIEGVHIPMSILAAFGLFSGISFFINKYMQGFHDWFNRIAFKIFVFSILMLLSITSFYMVYKDSDIISKDSVNNYYYYLLNDEVTALDWLKNNTDFSDVILANWFYGNLLPGITGRKVYAGHKIQTAFFDNKISNINNFLLSEDLTEVKRFLEENNISYIFLGKNDSMLRYGFRPEEKKYLNKVYDKDDVAIFKVNLSLGLF